MRLPFDQHGDTVSGALIRSGSCLTFEVALDVGSREWPWFKSWLTQHLGVALRAWFGSLEVIYDGKASLASNERYVFGYHPHGLFPIGLTISFTPKVTIAALR